jgi:hypothetical protein
MCLCLCLCFCCRTNKLHQRSSYVTTTEHTHTLPLPSPQVLMNRQPTLHKPSIMAHRVRVIESACGGSGGVQTIRMHYANCNSYVPPCYPCCVLVCLFCDSAHSYRIIITVLSLFPTASLPVFLPICLPSSAAVCSPLLPPPSHLYSFDFARSPLCLPASAS